MYIPCTYIFKLLSTPNTLSKALNCSHHNTSQTVCLNEIITKLAESCLRWVGVILNILNPKQKMGSRLQHVNLYTPSAQSLWVLGLSFFPRTQPFFYFVSLSRREAAIYSQLTFKQHFEDIQDCCNTRYHQLKLLAN